MSGTTAVNNRKSARTLPNSLDSRRRLTVTLGGARGWHTFKSLFLSRCEASQTFRATLQTNPDSPARPNVRPGDAVGVTYRDGKRKCSFSAPLVSLVWNTDGGEIVLGWPAEVHHLRRRAFERVTPPRGSIITVRLRPYDGYASSNTVREMSDGRLLDISAGGLRLAVADSRHFELGMTYRCSFTQAEPAYGPRPDRSAVVFDANVVHLGTGDKDQPIVGLQVVGLETQPDSPRTMDRLARVVACFQRAASRHG